MTTILRILLSLPLLTIIAASLTVIFIAITGDGLTWVDRVGYVLILGVVPGSAAVLLGREFVKRNKL